MYIIRRYQDKVELFLCSGSGRAFCVASILIALVVGTLAALALKFGSPPMNGRAWDSPIILDGAWRVFNGQVPHRDFYNYLGDMPFYLTALGMKLVRPCVGAIDYGNVVLMVALVVPALAVLRRRTSALLAFLFSLFIVFLVMAPRPLGDPYDYTDHAMLYNRQGDACLALYAILLFLPPRAGFGQGRLNLWEAVLAGVLLTALFGCKINYFVTGAGFFALAVITGRLAANRAAVVAAGAVAAFLIYLGLTHIPLSALLNDYKILMGCQSFATKSKAFAVQFIKAILFLPILFLLVWERSRQNAPETTGAADWGDWLIILGIFGGATFIISSNAQIGQLPLLVFGAFWGAELILRQRAAPGEDPSIAVHRHVCSFALFLFFLLPAVVLDFKTIRFATYAAVAKRWVSTPTLQSTQLKDFRFVSSGTRGMEMQAYQDNLDEGIALLRRHAEMAGKLNALLFTDPFNFALGWAPAKGGVLGVARLGLNARSHPPLDRLLGGARFLLTPSGAADMKETYSQEWNDLHLKLVEQTTHYALFALEPRHE